MAKSRTEASGNDKRNFEATEEKKSDAIAEKNLEANKEEKLGTSEKRNAESIGEEKKVDAIDEGRTGTTGEGRVDADVKFKFGDGVASSLNKAQSNGKVPKKKFGTR
eukprot:6834190-Karenia_brevis.AAC.1